MSYETQEQTVLQTIRNRFLSSEAGAALTAIAVTMGFGGQVANASPTAQSPAQKYEGVDCSSGDTYGVACMPNDDAVTYCLQGTYSDQPQFNVALVPESNKLETKLRFNTIRGCQYVGMRSVSLVEEIRRGPSGQFKREGPMKTTRTDGPLTVTTENHGQAVIETVLGRPMKCASSLTGSAVRVELIQGFKPNKYYHMDKAILKNESPTRTSYTRPKAIC